MPRFARTPVLHVAIAAIEPCDTHDWPAFVARTAAPHAEPDDAWGWFRVELTLAPPHTPADGAVHAVQVLLAMPGALSALPAADRAHAILTDAWSAEAVQAALEAQVQTATGLDWHDAMDAAQTALRA